MNAGLVSQKYDAPVITFSHFLPRRDLIRAEDPDRESVNKERKVLGLPEVTPAQGQGGAQGFNFARYAGCNSLEDQIRKVRIPSE